MEKKKLASVSFTNASIMFRNFAGKPDRYNTKGGKRTFCMRLNDKIASEMAADGWNIRYTKPRDDGDNPTPFIRVNVNYDYMPPTIYIVTSKNEVLVDEDMLEQLDYADVISCDIKIRPYSWEVNGKSGITAYLKTMRMYIEDDTFDDAYNFAPLDDDDVPF